MKPIPQTLQGRPFTRAMAIDQGISGRMLEGRRFRRVASGVWVTADHEMSWSDSVTAATLALPERARVTGLTRIHLLGLDIGPRFPLRFVIEGDYHLDVPGVYLHRTTKMPPHDAIAVTPTAAFLAYSSTARVDDAICVGDWLLEHDHTSGDLVRSCAMQEPWRAGALEGLAVLPSLRSGSRSVMESRVRPMLTFAGLPEPAVNEHVDLGGGRVVTPDLWIAECRTAVEYEGKQHQTDRAQYVSDIDRYADFRRASIHYVLVTAELLARRRVMVRRVHDTMVRGGYGGPPPEFGQRWQSLFGPARALVDPALRAAVRRASRVGGA